MGARGHNAFITYLFQGGSVLSLIFLIILWWSDLPGSRRNKRSSLRRPTSINRPGLKTQQPSRPKPETTGMIHWKSLLAKVRLVLALRLQKGSTTSLYNCKPGMENWSCFLLLRVLSIMPDRPIRDQWNYPKENGTTLFDKNKIYNWLEAFIYILTKIAFTSEWSGTGNDNFWKWNGKFSVGPDRLAKEDHPWRWTTFSGKFPPGLKRSIYFDRNFRKF